MPSPCHRHLPRRLLTCLLASCLLTAGLPATARTLAQLEHVSWTKRDGVPDDITSLAQTSDGWLWIGTPEGLIGIHVNLLVTVLAGVTERLGIASLRPARVTGLEETASAMTNKDFTNGKNARFIQTP